MTEVAELYSKDPMELTRDDISALVADLRKRRASFKLGDKSAGKAKASPKAIANLDLSALLSAKKPGAK